MDRRQSLDLLHQHASGYQFREFEAAFAQLLSNNPTAEDLADAYCMRAQIRLFSTDVSFLSDLESAAQQHAAPQLPRLIRQWIPRGPNRFVVFPQTPHALEHFLQALPQAYSLLEHWSPAAAAAWCGSFTAKYSTIWAALRKPLRLRKCSFQNSTATLWMC